MNRNRSDAAPRRPPPANVDGTSIWRCPACRRELVAAAAGLRCSSCTAGYPCVGDIPDLRLPGAASWIDPEQDRARAHQLLAETDGWPVEDIVRRVFAERPRAKAAWVELRTRQVLEAPQRLRSEVRGWLAQIIGDGGTFLDLGCGGGTLLAAAAAEGRHGVGIDVSLVWLVVARRLIAAYHGRPALAAAMAEALPLADGAIDAVMSLDVIEHVADPVPYLREINRVTRSGGRIALATPNRFSLTAEPHVFVWGVGWLPRPLQARYVAWRSGKDYAYTRLLSTREAVRLVHSHTAFTCRILIPSVAREEIARFPPWRAAVARAYNLVVRARAFRALFLMVGPFFRLVGIKA